MDSECRKKSFNVQKIHVLFYNAYRGFPNYYARVVILLEL